MRNNPHGSGKILQSSAVVSHSLMPIFSHNLSNVRIEYYHDMESFLVGRGVGELGEARSIT